MNGVLELQKTAFGTQDQVQRSDDSIVILFNEAYDILLPQRENVNQSLASTDPTLLDCSYMLHVSLTIFSDDVLLQPRLFDRSHLSSLLLA